MDKRPVSYVLTAAVLYGTGLPLSKLLVKDLHPLLLASLLYLGASAGLAIYWAFAGRRQQEKGLSGGDYWYLAASVASGGVLAPVLLMTGLSLTTGFAASLMSNLEGPFTSIIAVAFFRERPGKKLYLAALCMVAGATLLSYNPQQGGVDPVGPLLVALSMVCWGVDNNCMRVISDRGPARIALLKSLAAFAVPLPFAILLGGVPAAAPALGYAVIVGTFGYGASLLLFVRSLRAIGASRTAVLFGFAPFIAALVSLLLLREWLGYVVLPAAALMAAGVWLLAGEELRDDNAAGEKGNRDPG